MNRFALPLTGVAVDNADADLRKVKKA